MSPRPDVRKMTIFNDAYLLNHGTEDRKPHIQCVLLDRENTLHMKFVVVGAVVVVLRVVEDRHFPIQMYGVKKPGRFKVKTHCAINHSA